MTFPAFACRQRREASPSVGGGDRDPAALGCRLDHRKSLDLDPAFLPNQGSGLCYGSRYPLPNVRHPVGVHVVGSRTLVFAELGGGGKISAAASADGVSRPPAAGRGTIQTVVCELYYRLRRFPRQRVSSAGTRSSSPVCPFKSVHVRSSPFRALVRGRSLAVAPSARLAGLFPASASIFPAGVLKKTHSKGTL